MTSEPLKDLRILVVDDEADLLTIFEDTLSLYGANVVTAENGQEAVKLIKSYKPDVILSDIRMPEMDGMQLLKTINKDNLKVKVFTFVTGFSDYAPSEAFHEGAAHIFSKPIDFNKVVDEITRLITPIEIRIRDPRYNIPATFELNLKIHGSDVSTTHKVLNISKGGMFVASASPLPALLEVLKFSFLHRNSKGQEIEVSGVGICRWTRPKPIGELKAGFGLEFYYLESKSLEFIENIIGQLNSKSYIPQNS